MNVAAKREADHVAEHGRAVVVQHVDKVIGVKTQPCIDLLSLPAPDTGTGKYCCRIRCCVQGYLRKQNCSIVVVAAILVGSNV